MNTPRKPMNVRERQIESAFGWLKDVGVINVDGKAMMTDKETGVPYNVASVMGKKEFIKNWLIPFALGNEHGLHYFPTTEWIELSGDGLQSVMIVDDEDNKPLFIIPPLVSTNMGPAELKMLRGLEQAIKQIGANEQTKSNPDASAYLAEAVERGLVNVKRKTFPEMIPDWFYKQEGLEPVVEQQIYYIRDQVNSKVTESELTEARKILYRIYKGEKISKEDKDFITKISINTFTFGEVNSETAVKQNTPEQQQSKPDYDPLEC